METSKSINDVDPIRGATRGCKDRAFRDINLVSRNNIIISSKEHKIFRLLD